jgi:hypothetical protein
MKRRILSNRKIEAKDAGVLEVIIAAAKGGLN